MVDFEVLNPVELVCLVWAEIPICEFAPGLPDHRFNQIVTGHFKTRDDVIDIGFGGSYFGGEFRLGLAGFFEEFL